MSTTPLSDTINWLLLRTSIKTKHRLMKLAETYDMSLMQALTLCILEPSKPVAMSVISDTFSCDPSNVTGIVERLSVGNYIERRESKADRRVKTIELTKAGNKLRNELLQNVAKADALSATMLTTDEVTTLKALLNKIQNG